MVKINVRSNGHYTHTSTLAASNEFVMAETIGDSVDSNDLLVMAKDKVILSAIQGLNDKQNPFKDRCVYVIAKVPDAMPNPGDTVCLRFHVYVSDA